MSGRSRKGSPLVYKALGDEQRARELWREALRIFVEIESPHAATVRGWLGELRISQSAAG